MLSSLHRLRQPSPKDVDSAFLPCWVPGPPRRFDAVTALGAETAPRIRSWSWSPLGHLRRSRLPRFPGCSPQTTSPRPPRGASMGHRSALCEALFAGPITHAPVTTARAISAGIPASQVLAAANAPGKGPGEARRASRHVAPISFGVGPDRIRPTRRSTPNRRRGQQARPLRR